MSSFEKQLATIESVEGLQKIIGQRLQYVKMSEDESGISLCFGEKDADEGDMLLFLLGADEDSSDTIPVVSLQMGLGKWKTVEEEVGV